MVWRDSRTVAAETDTWSVAANANARAIAAESKARSQLLANEIPPGQATPYGTGPEELVETFGPAAGRPVVFLHGGFWRPAIDRTHARPLAAALAASGSRVLLAEYPRDPGRPDATADALIRLAAAAPANATWLGHSAGGQLALWLALTGTIDNAIGIAPISDLTTARAQRLGDGAVDAFFGTGPLAAWDPIELIDPHRLPSITLIHGSADAAVPIEQSRILPVPTIELNGAHHFDVIDPESPHFSRLRELLLAGGSTRRRFG